MSDEEVVPCGHAMIRRDGETVTCAICGWLGTFSAWLAQRNTDKVVGL